jgi:hypothetical protein
VSSGSTVCAGRQAGRPAAYVAVLLAHAVRTAEGALLDPVGGYEVQREESDVALWYLFTVLHLRSSA